MRKEKDTLHFFLTSKKKRDIFLTNSKVKLSFSDNSMWDISVLKNCLHKKLKLN